MVARLRPIVGGAFLINDAIDEELSRDADYLLAMKKIADDGAEYAQRIAPIDSGDLRASIISKGSVLDKGQAIGLIEVGDGAPHWIFVEYGTGQRGSSSEQPDPGLPSGYSHGQSAGMAAQPYMRPTLWWLKQMIGN